MRDERVFLCLGSNLGDRLANLRSAVAALGNEPRIEVVGLSSVYESAAMYMDEGAPSFLNMAVEIRTGMEPEQLLEVLHQVESNLGRPSPPRPKNQSRNIDIDIAVWGDREISSRRLTVPHPGLINRRFFLQPLADLDANLLVPRVSETVSQLAERLRRDQPLARLLRAQQWSAIDS